MSNVIESDFRPPLFSVELFSYGWRLEVKEIYANDRRHARKLLAQMIRENPSVSSGILYIGKIGIGKRKALDMMTRAQVEITSTDMLA